MVSILVFSIYQNLPFDEDAIVAKRSSEISSPIPMVDVVIPTSLAREEFLPKTSTLVSPLFARPSERRTSLLIEFAVACLCNSSTPRDQPSDRFVWKPDRIAFILVSTA